MMDLQAELEGAMKSASPIQALTSAIRGRLASGAVREDIIQTLEMLRGTASSSEEDVILEVLDYLTGWCRPELRL